jgi:type IV pilus assembly protein PilC
MVRSNKFRNGVERVTLKLPVVGPIVNSSCYARFTRTLSTTFSAGVPLVDALDSVAGATGNIVYATATRKIKDDVTTGQQLAFAIKNTTLFPTMIIQMVGIGEESGALDGMLDKCANYYEEEVDNAVDGLTALMEPMIMAVLGILVGGLMIAMYMPIFQIGAVM